MLLEKQEAGVTSSIARFRYSKIYITCLSLSLNSIVLNIGFILLLVLQMVVTMTKSCYRLPSFSSHTLVE